MAIPNEFLIIDQKLRIFKENSHNYSIKIKDDTGFYSIYNTGGYGDPDHLQVENVYYYLVYLEDQLNSTRYITYFQNTAPLDNKEFEAHRSNPTVEAIQNGVEILIDPEDFGISKFKDSFYKISLFSVFNNSFVGDGFKGQDFITNVPGAQIIRTDYTAIIVGGEAYRILDREGSTIFLDREIQEDFTEFLVGFYDEDELVLFQDLEDCILKSTLTIDNFDCGCWDKGKSREERIYLIAEAQLYLEGAKISLRKEDPSVAQEFIKTAEQICNLINCK